MDKREKTNVRYQYWFADPNCADGKTLKMSVVAPHSATHPPVHAEGEFYFLKEKQIYILRGIRHWLNRIQVFTARLMLNMEFEMQEIPN